MEDIKDLIEKYALQNAVKYDSTPQVDAVIKKLLGEHKELRPIAKEIIPLIREALERIEGMSSDECEDRLREIAPELISELSEKKEPDKGLPDLKIEGDEKVVMRFAPNPNGPATLGSVRGIIINSEYAKRYNGKFIIRFDDTDPQTKRPMIEAYEWYLEDCDWLDAKPDEVVIASDRIESYYEYAKRLIEMGEAYVCFCSGEEFKSYKDSANECPHRSSDPSENMKHWEDMLEGNYEEKEAVLRIKTDMKNPNPALRDWVAFRIVKASHPRTWERYIVWPMLDFESALEDHILGVTHIIRGKDLRDSERRQRFLYDHLGWTYPKTIHWGRVKIHEFGKFSTSSLKKGIEEGIYTGWDDPRLPTLRALKRRGIRPEAVRNFMTSLGVGETDISLSLETLHAENRKIVDPIANRYFFVWDPVKIEIEGGPRVSRPPIHPEKEERREIRIGSELYLCQKDISNLAVGDKIRLKDLFNVEITTINPLKAVFAGEKLEKIKIVHWVPSDYIKIRVISSKDDIDGLGEPLIQNELGNIVQFERFGFVTVDSILSDRMIVYFAHK
ncbi:MAG: glutamate--tRNA ligase [Halobacteriota archaeon]|nr:glutamate--tRNA ligase [Halobacteriota archaeon]